MILVQSDGDLAEHFDAQVADDLAYLRLELEGGCANGKALPSHRHRDIDGESRDRRIAEIMRNVQSLPTLKVILPAYTG